MNTKEKIAFLSELRNRATPRTVIFEKFNFCKECKQEKFDSCECWCEYCDDPKVYCEHRFEK